MKKIKALVLTAMIVSALIVCNYIEHNYTRKNCIIIDVTSEGIEIQDTCDEFWFYKTKDKSFKIGDVVDLKMYDSHTSNTIYDDVIKEIIKHK